MCRTEAREKRMPHREQGEYRWKKWRTYRPILLRTDGFGEQYTIGPNKRILQLCRYYGPSVQSCTDGPLHPRPNPNFSWI